MNVPICAHDFTTDKYDGTLRCDDCGLTLYAFQQAAVATLTENERLRAEIAVHEESQKTAWQQMTDAERITWLRANAICTIIMLTEAEFQRSQDPNYPRFTPQWEVLSFSEIDLGAPDGKCRGVLDWSRSSWIGFDTIHDVDISQERDDFTPRLFADPAVMRALSALTRRAVQAFAQVTDSVEDEVDDEVAEIDLLSRIIDLLKAFGCQKHDVMALWDRKTRS